jgi:hypothetical protein
MWSASPARKVSQKFHRLKWNLRMRGYTTKEKVKIPAGAVAALVITGWLVVLAIAILSAR